jgi:hypothetical protein
MKFKSSFISTLEFRTLHPEGVISNSDVYFATLANKILRTLLSEKIIKQDFSENFLRQIALKSVSYLEDTVSQWGLFNGFRKLHEQLCGNQMPFYTLNDDYYSDEINIEDVQFLVWSTLQEYCNEKDENRFINPDNPMIMFLSSLIFNILDDQYETAPENEKIYELLHERYFEDFFNFRQLLEWLCYNSYLSTNNAKNAVERLKVSIRKKNKEDKDYAKLFIYLVESNAIFYYVCTPLSVKAIDWFRSISTNSPMLERIENVSFRPFQRYKIMGSNDSFINLESFSEDKAKISLARESMNSLDANQTREFFIGKEIVQTSLVFFDGIWQINGASIFMEMTEEIQAEEDRKVEEKKRFEENVLYSYETLLKYNKNKQIAFLKNSCELEQFWIEAFSDMTNADDFIKNNPCKNKYNLVLFLYSKNGAFVIPNIADSIKYPGNKLYNSNTNNNEGLALLTGGFPAPLEFLEFIINNNYIPDARINSIQSTERGKNLVQDNKWFIVRFFQSELFDDNII